MTPEEEIKIIKNLQYARRSTESMDRILSSTKMRPENKVVRIKRELRFLKQHIDAIWGIDHS